jgi:chemotaxis protein histidine kinase CheA
MRPLERRGGRLGWRPKVGCNMNFGKQRSSVDVDKPETEIEGNIRELVRRDTAVLRQTGTDGEAAANNLSSLLRRVSANSTREIENLISELRVLRDKLQNDGSRVERDIVEYAALSQSVAQLTKIIADGVTQVKKVPDAPSISEE